MSIHPVVADAPGWIQDARLLVVAVPLALLIAWRAGVFRRGSVVGPIRGDPRTLSPSVLWVLALFAFAVWMLVPAVYVNWAHGDDLRRSTTTRAEEADATTAPSSQPEEFKLAPREMAWLGAASQLIALAALLAVDARMLKRDGLRLLGLSLSKLRCGLGYGIVGILVAAPLTWLISVLVQIVWERIGFRPPRDHELIRLLRDTPPPDLKWIVTISATVCAPLFEELLFRGHFQTALTSWFAGQAHADRAAWPRWTAIALSALAFASVHETGWMIPPLFVLAVCFGYAYERTANLWVPIVMHALFNGMSIAMVLLF